MDYKIIAPNKAYNGESAGVIFINGVGIAKDGKSVDWFKSKGYTVEPIVEDVASKKNKKADNKNKDKEESHEVDENKGKDDESSDTKWQSKK